MKYQTVMFALVGAASAREIPIYSGKVAKREVPQEHSHQAILDKVDTALKLNNPLKIVNAVFGLLGNKAAAEGAPGVQNLDCLAQIIADQAFTNSKAAGDVDGQAQAILFRALERNTGSVGLASVLCTQTAVNPEIAAITQHQDPASPEGIAGNKNIEIAVALQLAAIGADPILALQSGTFAPGKIGDPTGKGNTCDDANDAVGCIISQKLLTPAATEADIKAAVAAAPAAAAPAANANGMLATKLIIREACAANTDTSAKASARAPSGAAPSASATVNVQKFTGSLGGAAPPVISSDAERPFSVNGNTFLKEAAAIDRSCAIQKNACANAANSGQLAGGTAQCDTQEQACQAASAAKKARRRAQKARRQAALDFGSCGSPAIQFADGLDGRKEASFQSENLADFNHGSALNIKVIAEFTCNKLESTCKASDATVAACDSAASAASAQKGQAAADAFNSALGV
ncbi:hypothetical protein B0T26DRAFT_660140 [Lasiosphaeria miniovina]|uniref:Uncharacterized protein n=1 Tax=Lasiosphaeria miniovina TaxID=1954250 RepID=A0AA40DJD7_9PEZI|nr:uncharacterized protein B0T26DRAFT_660140 [Lasiosphaeria miniovina]KAK0702093.1 hypothetical protein B0T26DRAFT_660140 [Lasiosphaeria miniovina]